MLFGFGADVGGAEELRSWPFPFESLPLAGVGTDTGETSVQLLKIPAQSAHLKGTECGDQMKKPDMVLVMGPPDRDRRLGL
jgi:hypothetical protein